MIRCPNCGHDIIGNQSAAAKVLAKVGGEPISAKDLRGKLPDMSRKEVYNALAYLSRNGALVHTSHGHYQRAQR